MFPLGIHWYNHSKHLKRNIWYFSIVSKKKQTIPTTTTCYYAGLNRTIVYQSSPPHYYAYVIGSKSDFLPNQKSATQFPQFRQLSQSVSQLNRLLVTRNKLFRCESYYLWIWMVYIGGVCLYKCAINCCLFICFLCAFFYYIFVDFSFCCVFLHNFCRLTRMFFSNALPAFCSMGRKYRRDEHTHTVVCVCVCV